MSQSIRRIEDALGERLFDRSSKDATLTEAGRLLREYAERLLRLEEEAEAAVRELRDLRRGRVLLDANAASVPAVLPLVARFRRSTRCCTWTSAACGRGRSSRRWLRGASTSAC